MGTVMFSDGFTGLADAMVEELGLVTAAVYGRIWRYCQMERRVCDASQDTIGQGLSISQQTVSRHIKTLVDAGYVEDLTPDLVNHPHTYRTTDKLDFEVTVRVRGQSSKMSNQSSKMEDQSSKMSTKRVLREEEDNSEIGTPPISVEPVVNTHSHADGLKKPKSPAREKQEKRGAVSSAGGNRPAEGRPNDPWEGVPPQSVVVPLGGKKADRESYVESCDMCQALLNQGADECLECGRPVRWVNSRLADRRAELAKRQRQDELAKSRRENADRLSKATSFVLAIARATAVTHTCEFARGEEQALFDYEQAYGEKTIMEKTNELKAAGERGRGLITHLLNYLARHNDTPQKPKGGTKFNKGVFEWG